MKYTFSTSSVTRKAKLRTRWFAALAFLLFFVITGVFASAIFVRSGGGDPNGSNDLTALNGGGIGTEKITAHAASYSGDAFTVNEYNATVTINADRTIDFHERLNVRMNTNLGTQFYRSLPIDQGDAYFNVSATRSNESGTNVLDDDFKVIDNPDVSGYIDIVLYGGIASGQTWTYDFYYSMRSSEKNANGLTLDVVGGGWTIPLNNVSITVNFPAAAQEYKVYSDEFGGSGNKFVTVSEQGGGKTLLLTGDKLPIVYNRDSGDSSAAAVTIQFSLPDGAMISYAAMLLKSPSFWVVLAISAIAAMGALLLTGVFTVRHEMITVVSVKPPEGMDPLQMGRIIDGKVDTEDITSMIYYFADQGYLTIDLPEEKNDDPVLYRTDKPLPEKMPSWQKVLMDGLFDKGRRTETHISDLSNKFYASADKAKTLLSTRRGAEYEPKSFFGACLISLLAVCLYGLIPLFIGMSRIGGGYKYWTGFVSLFPIAACAYGYFYIERQRYKKKASVRRWANIGITVVLALFGVWYTALFARHILTVWEKLFISIGATMCAYFAPKCISRTEKYVETLGKILGFKDFILYTEEDKIKFMLQENPQLYYDVLPYAQVLGVTKEWEDKFKSITLEPPSWSRGGTSFSVFDYMVLNSVLRASFVSAMSRPQPKGGTFLGGGGGGGHFGGFSGGGHGGGGGGVR